jgi:hypothetical protein
MHNGIKRKFNWQKKCCFFSIELNYTQIIIEYTFLNCVFLFDLKSKMNVTAYEEMYWINLFFIFIISIALHYVSHVPKKEINA